MSMTLLEIINEAANETDLDPFDQVIGGDSNADTMLALAHAAGDEIATRVDWQALILTANIAGQPYVLPEDYHRLVPNAGLVTALGVIIRPVTNTGQWNILQQVTPNQPYYYRADNSVKVLPTSAAVGAMLNYVSGHWVLAEDGINHRDHFESDGDTVLFPDRLLVQNIIWRWKRAKGLSYDDQLAEFEATLQSEIKANRGIA